MSAIDAIFGAASVAVVGASSTRPEATGNQALRALLASSYSGAIHIVSASGGPVEGIETVPSVADLPPVDVAIVTVAPHRVASVIAALASSGARSSIVMSVGLDDDELAQMVAARGDMGVHGPNCMGVIDVVNGVSFWADEGNLQNLPPGDVALISQSGSGAIFVARSSSGIGFSRVISSGNESSLTTADYLEWLADDDETNVIGIVMESIADVDAFRRAARKAHRSGKRVVVLKVGRSNSGQRATVAHTGAVVSSAESYGALFDDLGIPVVGDYDELASALETLSILGPRRVEGRRVAAVTISGGQAALFADLADEVGLELAQFSPAVVEQLQSLLPGAIINNPLDAGASPLADEESYRLALEALARDPQVDALVVVLDAQTTLTDTEVSYEDEYFSAALEIGAAGTRPLVIASSSSVSIHPRRIGMNATGVPVLRGLRNAATAVRAAVATTPRDLAPRAVDAPSSEAVRGLREALASSTGPIPGGLARRILSAYGIPVVPSTIAGTVDEALGWADSHGYPVVMKVESPDIPHRSDVGGVLLGMATPSQVAEGWATIMRNVRAAAPHARITGVELQTQVGDSVEAFAGYVTDVRLGSTVAVGLGGTLVELWGDMRHTTVPTTPEDLKLLVAGSRLTRVLQGYRGLNAATDPEPLLDVVARLSWIAEDLGDLLVEVDLNPVLVQHGSGQVRVVDALMVASGHSLNDTARPRDLSPSSMISS